MKNDSGISPDDHLLHFLLIGKQNHRILAQIDYIAFICDTGVIRGCTCNYWTCTSVTLGLNPADDSMWDVVRVCLDTIYKLLKRRGVIPQL